MVLTEMTRKKLLKLRCMILNLQVKDLQDEELIDEMEKIENVCREMVRISKTFTKPLSSVIKLEEKTNGKNR